MITINPKYLQPGAAIPVTQESVTDLLALTRHLSEELSQAAGNIEMTMAVNDTLLKKVEEAQLDLQKADEVIQDALNTVLWLERRLHKGYGDVPHVKRTIASLEAAIRSLSTQNQNDSAHECKPLAWIADALSVHGSLPHGCHRSHPHENMDADCERKTLEARANHAKRVNFTQEDCGCAPSEACDICQGTSSSQSATDPTLRSARQHPRHEAERNEQNGSSISAPSVLEGWIRVEDRLPEFGKGVLITDGEWVRLGWHRDPAHLGPKAAQWNSHIGIARNITHWMPLPAAPIAQEGADK